MKYLLTVSLLLATPAIFGQAIANVPTPMAAFVSATGLAGSWSPLMGSGTATIPNVPSPFGIYCSTDGTGNAGTWAPCSAASLAGVVATRNSTAQTANLASTTLYTVPSGQGGMYEVFCYLVVTTAATTSSTLPNCSLSSYVDGDTGTTLSFSITNNSATNTVGTKVQTSTPFNVAAGSTISWATINYASSGATAMAYAAHIRLQYLGP